MKKYKAKTRFVKDGKVWEKGEILEQITPDMLKRKLVEEAEEDEEAKKPEVIEEPLKEEEEMKELTFEDIQKMTIDQMDAMAKDNDIKLEGKTQKEKAKELFNKLANNPEV
ncbi:hypothetical protein [Sebaldella termitidis]|uniref:hypothetical protein n=1 Tax=Sebaldella termitidis TaxID=826 RepID=UPI003EB7D04E